VFYQTPQDLKCLVEETPYVYFLNKKHSSFLFFTLLLYRVP